MELKRIVAKDSQSATTKAIELYGADALIVSSERVNGKVEVIVAVDIRLETKPSAASFALKGNKAFGDVMQHNLSMGRASAKAETQDGNPGQRDSIRAREIVDLVRGELAEMRREFRISSQVGMWAGTRGMSAELKPLVQALNDAQVPAAMRALLIDRAAEMESTDEAVVAIETWLNDAIARQHEVGSLEGVHVVAGPSGAGKTMMIGRLAMAHAKEYLPDQVAVISYSDLRPGAWSQTQMLAAQAGVDCFRASTDQSLVEILGELSTRRLVLIDTPGIQVPEHMARIRQRAPHAQCHLLLPVDSSVVTINRYLADHAKTWQSLMLSKLDEMAQPWPLIQALCDHPILLSFSSTMATGGGLSAASQLKHIVAAAIAQLRSQVALINAAEQGGQLNVQNPELGLGFGLPVSPELTRAASATSSFQSFAH